MLTLKTLHTLILGSLVSACFALATLSPALVQGQVDPNKQYRKLPYGAWVSDRNEFNRIRIDIPKILRGSDDFRAGQTKLDQYFKEYIFPQMTLPDDASLAALPERRKDFLSLVQRVASSQEAHDHVVGLTMNYMEKIATLDFHPAVRYNAMLIIGEMNGQEASLIGSSRTPPQPLEAALPILLRELDNPDQPDAVRVAALLGIHRHARMENENSKINRSRFTDAEIRPLIDRMLAIITATAPAGRSEEGHVWMQRRAIEVLAEIGKVDAAGSVATEIDKIVKNQDAPLSLRCTAARAIGKLSFTTVQNFDASTVALELGELAAFSCQQEIARVALIKQEKEERELRTQLAAQGPRGRSGGGEVRPRSSAYGEEGRQTNPLFSGGFGGQLGVEEVEADWQMLVTKRRLKYQLGSVLMALTGSPVPGATTQTGLLARAAAGQKASVQKLVDAINGLLTALDANVTTQDDLLKQVATSLAPLETIVGVNSGSGAEALGPGAPAALGAPTGPGAPAGPGVPPGPGAGGATPRGPAPGQPAPGQPGPGQPGPGQPAPAPGAPVGPGPNLPM
jgi:hypothetical protein